MRKTKILFNIINTIFIVLYVYPGSILGFLIYGELSYQPQLTSDFGNIFASNHVYAFFVLSMIGLFAYYQSNKIVILNYLILSSIILEVLHSVIPNRAFEYSDLFGNILGVLISILIFSTYNFWRKK